MNLLSPMTNSGVSSLQYLDNDDVLDRLRRAGFGHCIKMGKIKHEKHVVSALVERWRPETNSFWLPNGETTITLEDVAYITGLSVTGSTVIGPSVMLNTLPYWLNYLPGHPPILRPEEYGNTLGLVHL